MGLNVMRWPLRPAGSKRYQVNIILHSLEGLSVEEVSGEEVRLIVNVKWNGPKGSLGSRFGMKRAHSRSMLVSPGGAVEWEHNFENICAISLTKDGTFQSWPVTLIVCKPVSGVSRAKPFIVGTFPLDLGELAGNATADSASVSKRFPITCNIGGSDVEATLSMSIAFIELRTMFEGFESVQRLMAPAIACMSEPMLESDDEKPDEKPDEKSLKKKGSSRRLLTHKAAAKKPVPEALEVAEVSITEDVKSSPARSEGKFSPTSDGSLRSSDNPFDSDSLEESLEEFDVEDYVDTDELMLEKSISYGTLAGANLVAEEVIPFHREEDDSVVPDVGDIMTVHSRATSGALPRIITTEELPSAAAAAVSEDETPSTFPSPLSMRSMLSWRKRKLSFRSPRSRGEPLLNKAYGEEGGDEIDWDRRQSDAVSSEEKLLLLKYRSGEGLSATSSNAAEVLDFGDELFTVGSWEMKDLVSRDGQIKLSANVFFASFDQRSESAAGESACTALVAVIADWLHTHPGLMPSKAEFDMLIRDGSAEWRKLCEVETYKDRFRDGHFDLETVLEAGVRPLAVVSDKSFVGFFQPERSEELGEAFDFLKHAMTFDSIWDEIERCGPAVYIVSWNDHFFVLRFEEHCCYIIDTLGERLYEGCNQAYILHFDETTSLCNVPVHVKPTKESKVLATPAAVSEGVVSGEKSDRSEKSDKSEKTRSAEAEVGVEELACEANGTEASSGEVVFGGKGACRQFVKGFFAAIQLREVEMEAKKCAAGKSTQMSIYQKLQIEFHYAKAVESFPTSSSLGGLLGY